MNTADLTALRELHRLISRSFSVHAAYAPALERAIEELDDLPSQDPRLQALAKELEEKRAGAAEQRAGWLSEMSAAADSFDRPRPLPMIKPGDPAPAGAHFEQHGDKMVFRSPLPYGQDALVAKVRPSIEERTAELYSRMYPEQARDIPEADIPAEVKRMTDERLAESEKTQRITLAPGETFRNITNAGKVPFAIPAHWPLPLDLDE